MIIDANMYWIPEALFTDEDLMSEFMHCIPNDLDIWGKCEQIPGTDKKQVVIEEPKGYQNLNYVQGEYILEQQLADMDKAGVDKALRALIQDNIETGISREQILEKLQKRFQLSEAQAEEYYNRFSEES